MEQYITEHYPKTIEQANNTTSLLMGKVSELNNEVLPDYNFEFLYL